MTLERAMPELIPPMLAALGRLPAGGGWAFEFKYDGVRAVTYVDRGAVRVLSRNNNDVTGSYPELAALGELLPGRRAILDGEIVALEPGDRPSFARLAGRMHVAEPSEMLLNTVPVVYYVFDLLWLDGTALLEVPYEQRRRLLTGLALDDTAVRTPPNFVNADGQAVLRAAEVGGLEGVIAKRLAAPYRPGRRAGDSWTKVPLIRTQEVVILGWKPGEGRRASTIGSLLLGVLDQHGQLRFAGHVGTGFTGVMLRLLQDQLTPLRRGTSPARDVPREHARHAHWVEPALVGEVAFRNWTPDGRLRHASWRGLRPDRSPGEARRQPASSVAASAEQVEGALETSDGRWRVEVVGRDGHRSYRLLHADNLIEGLDLDAVQRLLAEQHVDLADLVEPARVTESGRIGAA
ncbi:non-homologous end-joining DNA ligase [Actinoplanes sp. NPDC051343]|uniref:non-homologous end-joining DNA ligase n=1 Tax=Actinoplanes sp. NPDC051343 TaxID=3363906 RepID=UPI0037ADE960